MDIHHSYIFWGKKKHRDISTRVKCYVAFSDGDSFRNLVEDNFRDYLRLDIEYMKKNHPDHFSSPHNIARAILIYKYFREEGYIFDEDRYKSIYEQDLPSRTPDVSGTNYAIWAEDCNTLSH